MADSRPPPLDSLRRDTAKTASPAGAKAGHPHQAGAAEVLALEGKVRAARDEVELMHLIANESRRLFSARQVLLLRRRRRRVGFDVVCVSSMALIDSDTPFIRWIEAMVGSLVGEHGDGQPVVFDLPAFTDPASAETISYPFGHFLWQPFVLVSGATFAGALFARDLPWSEHEAKLIARECGVFADRWQALYGAKALFPRRAIGMRKKIGLAAALLGVSLLPVPLTTLAPVEIVAKDPQRITAPIDGVIDQIFVDPNSPVKAGQVILRFEETMVRNRLQVAEQELLVAKARLERTGQAAFTDASARHELGVAEADYELKKADRDYALDLLTKSQIVAKNDGVLVFDSKDRWIGRPVKTGERIMQVVNPDMMMAKIELPVADAIVLQDGTTARLFLDANPLSSLSAKLVGQGYQAEPNSTNQLVFRLLAEIEPNQSGVRIGSRGTAQLRGQRVALIYYLVRRPLSALRQHIGL